MMEGRPIKFRVLEILSESGEAWNKDIVSQLQSEYGAPSRYSRDCLNFDLIEMGASGMIAESDAALDEDGSYGHLLVKYRITTLGNALLEELRGNVKPRGA
ncbi:MAG: hypothetical protein LBG62_04060 [Candidatus Methanoplasma sp.]|jgi:hypothetical protein|nr:hypothetical protein [Candidatus Methanoplasma sp.]